MLERLRARWRRSTGQALVEFVLVAPIFFLLLFAVIEGGRFVYYYQTLANATREGARFAIVNGSNTLRCSTGPAVPPGVSCDPSGSLVKQRVLSSAIGLPLRVEDVDARWMDDDDTDGDDQDGYNSRGYRVRVSASYTYRSLIPIVPLPPITVSAESTLVINN